MMMTTLLAKRPAASALFSAQAAPAAAVQPQGERTAAILHRWQAPGTCGELLQGALDGQDFMVNCPIDLFATVEARASAAPGIKLPNGQHFGKLLETLQRLQAQATDRVDFSQRGLALQISSPIPRSKGMASSTADASAALAAACACLGITLDEHQMAQLLTSVEPSDCTHFQGIAQLNFLSGELLARLPAPRGLRVLVVDCGGEVQTLHFDRARARATYAQYRDRLQAALRLLKHGLASGNLRSVAQAATESSTLSQMILPKWAYPELLARAESWGLLGINCAHSGTVLGLLYDAADGREPALRQALAGAFGKDLPIVGDFCVIGGGNRAV